MFSASNVLEAIGRALHEIRHEDGLTWADIGATLGVSDDQAAKYASGMAAMSIVTFSRGEREWNGRFTGYLKRLILDSRPGLINGHMALTHMLSATSAIHSAMADGEITPREIRESRQLLENARDELDQLLGQLKVAAA